MGSSAVSRMNHLNVQTSVDGNCFMFVVNNWKLNYTYVDIGSDRTVILETDYEIHVELRYCATNKTEMACPYIREHI